VPFLGPVGILVDYTMLTTDRTVYDQNLPVYILARADTPSSVTDALRSNGVTVDSRLSDVQRSLDQSAYALALRLYAVVAVLVLLMALAGLFVSTAVQLPSRRKDAASLRVVGVSRRAVMSSVVREFAAVLGGTAVAGLAAGTLAQYVVLRTVTLGYVQDFTTPALIATVDWHRLIVLAAVTGSVFAVVAMASAALTVRGARGSTLRENAR
jgi:predicted lysophospholipase L1 biosynthesis ABC-type transport system permease subunit